MGDIQTVCERLADAVATVANLEVKGWLDDSLNPPEAQVFTRAYDPRFTFSGNVRPVAVGVRVFVKRTDLHEAQMQLRNFMDMDGPQSIRAAIEDSGNWPTGTNDVTVTGIGQPFEATAGQETYLAVDFDIDVIL